MALNTKYIDNNVTFNKINAGIHTGGQRISAGEYTFDSYGNIITPYPVVNAIDIDWNDAEVPGLPDNINSTGKLLSTIGDLKSSLNSMDSTFNEKVIRLIDQAAPKEKYKHVVLTQEEFENMYEYEEDTLYMVIGDPYSPDPNSGGGGGSSTINPFEDIKTELLISYIDDEGITQEIEYREDGKISLAPQRSYTLNGTLIGSIEIDTSSLNKVYEDTEIILDNVKILSNTESAIVYKIPEDAKGQKSLKVTLSANSENYIYCTLEGENADDQPGAINSMNNLYVQGVGYLAIKTKKGHGIRGDEVNLGGSHIWISAPHDGIHGRNIHIIGGVYSLNNCNDGIGTSERGRVFYYDGKILSNNIVEDIIDSKNPGLYFSEDLLTEEQLLKCKNMSLLSAQSYNTIFENNEPAIEILPGQPDFDKDINTSGAPVTIEASKDVYEISSARGNKAKYILVSGYINKPIYFSGYGTGASGDNVTVYLYNAFIDTGAYNEKNEPSIYYEDTVSNIKIMSVSDTVNIIRNNYSSAGFYAMDFEGDCVKSENNIEVEIKNNSYLYISSLKSDGIDGDEIRINDSKGSLIITKCGQRGIKGNAIVIGPNAIISDSAITTYINQRYIEDFVGNNPPKYVTYDGICYVKNNCQVFIPEIANGLSDEDRKNSGFADIYARNGKATKNKGQIGTQNTELNGVLIVGYLGAIDRINMGQAKRFYYNSVVTTNNNIQNPVPATGTPLILNEVESVVETKNVISF